MRKSEQFIYNFATLTYERVEVTLAKKLSKVFGFLSAVLVTSAVVVVTALQFIKTPGEIKAQAEIEQWRQEVREVNKELDLMTSAMTYLQQKDLNVYRMVMEADPVDQPIWKDSKTLRNGYSHLDSLTDSELLQVTYAKIENMKKQMVVQRQSYEEIATLVKGKEDMLASIPSIIPIKKTLITNGSNFSLLSGYGMRLHPVYKIMKMHYGIDLGAPMGAPIQASGDGTVIKTQYESGGYGNNVVIDHGYGYQTLYAHMSRVDVKVGQKVKKGQTIGAVGSTGLSTNPHLHYEVHKNGNRIDPKQFCYDGLTPAEYDRFVKMSSVGGQTFH